MFSHNIKLQAHFCSTKCCWFWLENAKALYSLNKRVNKLLRWELFLEQLNGIKALINRARLDTELVEVQAKATDADSMLGFTVFF